MPVVQWIKSSAMVGMVAASLGLLLLVSCSLQDDVLEAAPLTEQEKVVKTDGDILKNKSKSDADSNADKLEDKSDVDDEALGIRCGNLTCSDVQTCVQGMCQCKKGLKMCAGSCIPKASCCRDQECQGTEECIAGECRFSCAKVICPTNQVCDQDQKRCTCPSGYRFCEVQHKCVPMDHCCDKFDCDRGLICTATVYSARVCLFVKSPTCKYLGDKSSKIFEADNNQTFEVTAAEFLYGKKVKLLVDSHPLVMGDGSREVLDGSVTLTVDDVRELGGTCRQPKARERI